MSGSRTILSSLVVAPHLVTLKEAAGAAWAGKRTPKAIQAHASKRRLARAECRFAEDAELTMGEVAYLLCASRWTVRELLRKGTLCGERDYCRPDEPDFFRWRIPLSCVLEYAEQRQAEAS